MDRFPKMLFQYPGREAFQDGLYSHCIVHDEDEHADALNDGWHEDPPAARRAHEESLAHAAAETEAAAAARDAEELERLKTAPPTRDEMETQATNLGLKFDGRTSDKKLLGLIEAALAPSA